jgi:predicted metal-dependent phosphoesterase TrpH
MKREPTVDLHTHSTASDGTFPPGEVIRRARSKNLAAVALTDHDCVDGLPEAGAAARELGIDLIPGLEISAEFSPGTMHILGLFVDENEAHLAASLARLQAARKERNPQIAENLRSLGLDITYEEVVAASGGGQVGRPHFARVLVQKGYVGSFEEAFEKYLGKGKPGYAEKFRFSPREAIEMIHRAGGVASLAHPFTLGLPTKEAEADCLTELVGDGLDGLEAYYSGNSPGDTLYYLRLCESRGLIPTGGSDFHGANRPEIEVGTGRGNLEVPASILDSLRSRSVQYRRGGGSG